MQSCRRRAAGAQSGAVKAMRMMGLTGRRAVGEVDSMYAWLRLLAGVLTSTIGGVGMWSIAVVLPTLQADFGVTRADVSLAYTAVMLGAVVGGPVMGSALLRGPLRRCRSPHRAPGTPDPRRPRGA